MPCVFCEIIHRERDAKIKAENEDLILFENIWKPAPTMLLVCPKKHMTQREFIEKLGGQALRFAEAYCKLSDIEQFRIVQNIGLSVHQTQEHAHIHIGAGKGMINRFME